MPCLCVLADLTPSTCPCPRPSAQVIRLAPNLPDPYHTLGLLHEATAEVKKASRLGTGQGMAARLPLCNRRRGAVQPGGAHVHVVRRTSALDMRARLAWPEASSPAWPRILWPSTLTCWFAGASACLACLLLWFAG